MKSLYKHIMPYFLNTLLPIESTVLKRKQIWQCATPKSASTYLSQILKKLWQENCCFGSPVPYYNDRVQEPDVLAVFRRICTNKKQYYSGHLHQRYTNYFYDFFLRNQVELGGGVIVQSRDLMDTIVSLKDHYEQDFVKKGVFGGPWFVTLNSVWPDLSGDEKFSLIAKFYVAWHFDFLRSWKQCSSRSFEVKYVDLINETKNVVMEICDCFSITKSEEEIEKAISMVEAYSKEKKRLNVGISGRGKAIIPVQVQRYIKEVESLLLKS